MREQEELQAILEEFDSYDRECMPELLRQDVEVLREGILKQVSYIDCLQDEIRGSAHGVTWDEDYSTSEHLTEEKAEEVISFYCRRRW